MEPVVAPLPLPMRIATQAAPLMLFILLEAASALAAPRAFTVDGRHSRLRLNVEKAGALSVFSRDQTIEARGLSGEITFDPREPENTRMHFRIAVPHAMASKRGRSARAITFQSTSVRPLSTKDDLYLLRGWLTLHGVTRPVEAKARLSMGPARTLRAQGQVTLAQSDYGIEPRSAALGTVRVKDEVTVSFDLACREGGQNPISNRRRRNRFPLTPAGGE